MMKTRLVALLALVFSSVAAAAGQFEFVDRVALGVPMAAPARLSPDGKFVLFVKDEGGRKYSYNLVGVDGKGARKLLDSPVGKGDAFNMCFGSGIFSPDGKCFSALTTDNGLSIREGGRPRAAICDLKGKTTSLPSEYGWVLAAHFGADGRVYYADLTSLSTRGHPCALKSFDLKTGKGEALLKFDDQAILCTAMSPDRKRIAALAVKDPPGARLELRLWVYDVATGKAAESPLVMVNDWFFDDTPWLFWSADGRAVYTNGVLLTEAEAASIETTTRRASEGFSILRFEPFVVEPEPTAEQTGAYRQWVEQLGAKEYTVREQATAKLKEAGRKALAVVRQAARSSDPETATRAKAILAAMGPEGVRELQKAKSLVTLCELAPGRLSATSLQRRTRPGEVPRQYVVDVAEDTGVKIGSPLVLMDREGSTGLFINVEDRRYWTATIVKK